MPHRSSRNDEIAEYVTKVSEIHSVVLARLADDDSVSLPEMGEILEDAANHFLDISDDIRKKIIAANR